MIRRDVPLTDSPTKWLLISQVEHARVSAALAEAWGGEHLPPVVGSHSDGPLAEVRREVLRGILHHDDGWAAWEASPTVDPSTGRPYSFTELPREQALPLWHDSILRGRKIGPLAGWMVAGHFELLLAESDDADLPLCQAWLEEVRRWRQQWLTEWQSSNRLLHPTSLATECLDAIRRFDWLSLWLCCQCPALPDDARTEPLELEAAPGQTVRIAARHPQAEGAVRTLTADPWPFSVPHLEIDVLGYAVPVDQYPSSHAIARVRSPLRLRWHLVPR